VSVDWLAVNYQDCSPPLSAGLIFKPDELLVGLAIDCPHDRALNGPCLSQCPDEEVVSNVHAEFLLAPGTYSVTVECAVDGVFQGVNCSAESFVVVVE
jgi:hypothetical protein